MGLLDFIERGPDRRVWLDEQVGDLVEYFTPPNLRPAVEFAAQMNPIQGMSDSMSQFGVAVDPSRSMEDRRSAALGSVVEGLLAVTPAALAAKGYMTPAQATMEGLLGGSPATKQIGDDLGRFALDEAGNIRVWHGSPHDFDKFSMDKIGTGEGAQAYGHGLYFAENADVAKDYQDALRFRKEAVRSRLADRGLSNEAADVLAEHAERTHNAPWGGDFDDFFSTFGREGPSPTIENYRAKLRAEKDEMRQAFNAMRDEQTGHLYEVNIDANPEDFLDWDKPITEAPQSFQNLVRRRMDEVELPEGTRRQRQLAAWRGDWVPPEGVHVPPPRTAEVRNWLWDYGGDQAAMTDDLLREGISGISYLDAGSRGAGEGSRNYVVFDDGLLSILSKDGAPVTQLTDAEAMARDILDLRAAGRASEVTDDMMAAADPQYMFNNTPLDMSQEARMARAQEMGFDTGTPLYHGTDAWEITAFNPSKGMESLPATFFSDSRDVAGTYGDVGEYFARIDYPAEFDFSGRSRVMFNDEYLSPGGLVRQVKQAADDAARYGAETETDLAFDLQSAGIEPMYADEIDAVRMKDVVDSFGWDGEPANNLAIFAPRNIRRQTARFDPAFRHLANLNASVPTKAIPAYTAGLLALGTALHKEKEGGQ